MKGEIEMELNEVYRGLVAAAKESMDAEEILEVVQRKYLGIESITGKFDELYEALSLVFASLPPTELVETALKGNILPLQQWHSEQVAGENPQWNEEAAEMTIDGGDITFITPTSSRKIIIDKDYRVICDFGVSITAASCVLEYARYFGPCESVEIYTSRGFYFYARDITLTRPDILYVERNQSADKNVEYNAYGGNEPGGVFLTIAPEWMK